MTMTDTHTGSPDQSNQTAPTKDVTDWAVTRLKSLERLAADWGAEVGSERWLDIQVYRYFCLEHLP